MNYGVFDIEANKWVKFVKGGFFDGTTYRTFDSPREFLNMIDRKEYKGWKFYAHFGGRYDFLFMLEDILNRQTDVRMIPVNGKLIKIMVTTAKSRFTLCDSYALLPDSLKNLTHGFNVEHKKKDFDVKQTMRKNDPRMLKYLENDCIGLYEVLSTFFASDFCVHPKDTIASQALDTFRSIFAPGELHKIRCEESFRENFYSGGRVEVYKGMGEISYFDVNSLFPTAMLNPMPCGKMKKTTVVERGRIGFYSVNLKSTPDWYISPLLKKKRLDETRRKLFFVNGPGEYFLSSTSLAYLRSEFGIRYTVNYGFVFPDKRELFNDYVTKFYRMKQENKGNPLYFIAKYMLNSLYGKFGQSRWRESIERWNHGRRCYAMPGGEDFGLELVTEKSRSRFILPYLAAYITELARLEHFKIMNMAPESVFYCDTDSILTNKPSVFNKLLGKGIGQLSNAWDEREKVEAVFLAPKFYALRGLISKEQKIVCKGFNREDFSFNDFKRALTHGKELVSEREKMLGYAECLDLRRMEGSGGQTTRVIKHDEGAFLKVIQQTKEVRTRYDKRRILESSKFVFDTETYQYSEVIPNKRKGK